MADPVGSWGGLQVRLTLPEVTSVTNALSSVLDLINTALDIGLTILQVVKTFTIPVLNPIKALLDELIKLCQNAILDLRRMGLYAHLGDFKLLNSRASMSGLKGGYAGYQRRMVTRFTDRRDPRRPDFSPDATVLALFVYTGVDVSFVDGILDTSKFQALRRTGAAFGRLLGMTGIVGRNTSLPVPVNVRATYPFSPARTNGGSPVADFALASSEMLGRDSVTLSWNIAPAPGAPDNDPSPSMPPAGFLVEVSCYPQGFYAGWVAPTPSGTGGAGGSGSTDGQASYSTGPYQEGDSGHPLQIFGGLDTMNFPSELRWESSFDGDTLRNGATPIFFYRDPSVPETLHNPFALPNGQRVNQKVFFVPRARINAQALVGGTFTLTLDRAELPLKASFLPTGETSDHQPEVPTEVYVRVISVTDAVTDQNFRSVKWNPVPRRSPANELVNLASPFGMDTKGVPSEPVKVTFPTSATDNFTIALQTALAVALLSRSDIIRPDAIVKGPPPEPDPDDTYAPTGLEGAMRNIIPGVVPNPQTYFATQGSSPDAFTRDLYTKIVSLTDQITQSQGNLPQGMLDAQRAQFQELIDWKWSDSEVDGARGNQSISQTILESVLMSQRKQMTTVLARNVYCLPGHWAPSNPGGPLPQHLNEMARVDLTQSTFGTIVDPFGAAPVVYDRNRNALWHVRHLIPPRIYNLASQVLNLTGANLPQTGGWVAWRPFMGLSPLAANTRILRSVEGFLRAASAGTAAAEDAILNVINSLEQRIKEIQELVRRIREYLEIPFQISIPDLVALPLLVNGTEGVISGLAQAQNKPTDGPNAYSGGLVLVAGGLPAILTDLLLLVLSQA